MGLGLYRERRVYGICEWGREERKGGGGGGVGRKHPTKKMQRGSQPAGVAL